MAITSSTCIANCIPTCHGCSLSATATATVIPACSTEIDVLLTYRTNQDLAGWSFRSTPRKMEDTRDTITHVIGGVLNSCGDRVATVHFVAEYEPEQRLRPDARAIPEVGGHPTSYNVVVSSLHPTGTLNSWAQNKDQPREDRAVDQVTDPTRSRHARTYWNRHQGQKEYPDP